MKQALEKSEGSRRVTSNALMVSVLGMNSVIHPFYRLCWKKRHLLFSVLSHSITVGSVTEIACKCTVEFKESIRRMVCNSISSCYSTIEALRFVEHPIAVVSLTVHSGATCRRRVRVAARTFARLCRVKSTSSPGRRLA